jgi:uncharacterized protein YndB with AHSA1/START domain
MATFIDGKATTIKTLFSRETAVNISINADAASAWALLTNGANYPHWNSTVVSIEGKIAQGEQIQLKSTLDPKRTFKLTVKEFHANKRLVWGDEIGNRIQ